MKKPVVVLCCLAVVLLFLPSQLPAPGSPTFDVTKTCVMEGDQWYYKVVVVNTSYYPILVTAYDSGVLLFADQEVLKDASFTFEYGRTSSCSAASNTVEVTSQFRDYVGYSWTGSSTAKCTCLSGGCTLTWGYWKTHSDYGPAPSDDTWDLLPGGLGEDTIFFTSNLTYYAVMWTDPGDSNPYFSLAHQYIAAILNLLKGATAPPEVVAAIGAAENLFLAYSPGQVGGKSAGSVKAMFKALVPTLDNYNMGVTGPGHCTSIKE